MDYRRVRRRDDEERWAEVEDFPNYAVSDRGRVRNLRTNRFLHPRINSYGYGRVGLRRDGETHEVYVHRLVAQAFITRYHPGLRIRHINGNEDNSVYNLKFPDDYRMGKLRERPLKAKSRRVRVVETGEVFLTVENLARHIGGDPSTIYRVLRGERPSHKGLTFEYYYEEYDG